MSRNNKTNFVSAEENSLSDGFLLAWYGDDFTGAAAVMEVLTFAGLPSILFIDSPTQDQLEKFTHMRAIGVASTARAKSPEWMSSNLPKIFNDLKALKPQILHYKVCSTLDSSPTVGSIGRAIEIGAKQYGVTTVPVVIAAPKMNRFQCFGHLFAGVGNQVFRLDQHPVMSQHPVSPMNDANVASHISKQSLCIDTELLSFDMVVDGHYEILPKYETHQDRITILSIDSINAETDAATGKALWDARTISPFVIGSQGVEYALVEYWQRAGLLKKTPAPPDIGKSKQMVSVSGSVSQITAEQIAWSRENGFACIEFDATQVCGSAEDIHNEIGKIVKKALQALSNDLDPLIYTARGPGDRAVPRFRQAVENAKIEIADANQLVGEALGRILVKVLEASGTRRVVVSGGDTSGFAIQQLGIFALTALAPTIAGASIFRAHADNAMDGLEIALKGGQMGTPDYFGWVRDGGGVRK